MAKSDIDRVLVGIDELIAMLHGDGFSALRVKLLGVRKDIQREKVVSSSKGKVFMIDSATGDYVEFSENVAENLIMKIKDPELYRHYQGLMQEFLANFADDSMFVKMYGRKGEKVFP